MRGSHCLETDMNLMSDFAGTRTSISVRRSMLLTTTATAGTDEDVRDGLLVLVDRAIFFDIFFYGCWKWRACWGGGGDEREKFNLL